MIPLCDTAAQYNALRPEIDAAMQQVCAAGTYILGPNVRAFERELAAYVGCRYAVGLNSGTDALHLALRALDIGPGDEVITTPFTFVATTEAIGLVGATPVFVDIDPQTFNIDAQRIEAAITARTRAILPVHLYGSPCDLDPIVALADRHNLHLVEDCAQATGAVYGGARVGSFGQAGCFSFFPSKNLGCLGDGGMLVTNDEGVFSRVESLRRHGGKVKYFHDELGLNSRLDEIHAATLRIKLRHLDRWNESRRAVAQRYCELLADVAEIQLPAATPRTTQLGTSGFESAVTAAATTGVYNQFTIQTDRRDEVAAALSQQGIGCAVYYPVPLHLQRVHHNLEYKTGDFPRAEAVARRCLSLPMYPEITLDQQRNVVQALRLALARRLAAA